MNLSMDGRLSDEYEVGVDKFIKYAFRRTGENYEIKCPCVRCCNSSFQSERVIRDHLIAYGIVQGYNFWYHHGERVGEVQSDTESEGANEEFNDDDEFEDDSMQSDDDLVELITECFANGFEGDNVDTSSFDDLEEPNDSATKC